MKTEWSSDFFPYPIFWKWCVHQTISSVQMHGICRSWYYMRLSLCYCKYWQSWVSLMHPSMMNVATAGRPWHYLSAIFVMVIVVFIYKKLFDFTFKANNKDKPTWVSGTMWLTYIGAHGPKYEALYSCLESKQLPHSLDVSAYTKPTHISAFFAIGVEPVRSWKKDSY